MGSVVGLELADYCDIPGYHEYRVGTDGTVWSRKRSGSISGQALHWRQMKTPPNGEGYPTVGLYRDGKRLVCPVHILLLAAFVGPCPTGMQACHDNDIKTDNRLQNLRWDMPKANCADRERNGKTYHPIGERNTQALLTPSQVRKVRIRFMQAVGTKEARLKAVAQDFGRSWYAIRSIIDGKNWSHIE